MIISTKKLKAVHVCTTDHTGYGRAKKGLVEDITLLRSVTDLEKSEAGTQKVPLLPSPH